MKTRYHPLLFPALALLLFCASGAHARVNPQYLADAKAAFPPVRIVKVPVRLAQGRNDIIEVQVPHIDIWSKYHGMMAVATPESLPGVVAWMERESQADARIASDYARHAAGTSEREQARLTARWLRVTLRAYIAKLRQIL